MNKSRIALITLLAFSLLSFGCGEKPAATPQITLSLERVPANGITVMHGTGFTPLSTAESHLKRPDGTEFNVLLFETDEDGEFKHEIESFLLLKGVHEVWVIDTPTGLKSNTAKFETTLDPIPLAE